MEEHFGWVRVDRLFCEWVEMGGRIFQVGGRECTFFMGGWVWVEVYFLRRAGVVIRYNITHLSLNNFRANTVNQLQATFSGSPRQLVVIELICC